jgi:hypothetical protein
VADRVVHVAAGFPPRGAIPSCNARNHDFKIGSYAEFNSMQASFSVARNQSSAGWR